MEAGNIGSGHAAIALSQLMGKKIMIAIPSISLIELTDLSGVLEDGDRSYVLVDLMVLGDIKGTIIFTLDEVTALALCDIIMGQPKNTSQALGEIELSAIKEVGSIMSASYLNAVGDMIGKSLIVSVPEFQVGKREVLEKILAKKNIERGDSDQVFCIKTEFVEAAEKIEGYLIFMPSGNSIETIVGLLGV